MTNKPTPRTIPTVRIKADTKDGFALINAHEFNHDEHELFDKKDKHLIPPAPTVENIDNEALRKSLAAARDQNAELESELAEWKARAEAAEAKLAGAKQK